MSTIKTDNIVNRTGDQDSGLDLGTNDVVKVKIAGAEKARVHSDGSLRVDAINNQSGDNDSGIDLSTNDVVAVKTANTERLRVDASGDVTMSTDSSLTIQGTHNEGGGLLDLKGTDTPAANKNLGGLNFGNSSDRSLAMIRGVSSSSDAANMRFYTEASGASIEERMRIAEGGGLLLNANYNFHAIGGAADPSSAFQFDFSKNSYAHPMKISCAISHWNSGYMSYTEGWYWGFNTSISSGNVTSYNGGNGSWTISFPSNYVVRVRMNGDASYNHSSGWYIKIEGCLQTSST